MQKVYYNKLKYIFHNEYSYLKQLWVQLCYIWKLSDYKYKI